MDAPSPRSTPSAAPFAALALVAAAASTTVELLLPRLLAPHVGTTTVPWATSIAVVLLGMAAGNAAGGRRADEPRTTLRTVAWTLLLAGAAVFLVPVLAGVLAPAVGSWPLLPRALAISLAALPAAAILGAVSPLATAMAAARARRTGRAVGALVAAGAVGSLAGVYGTGFAIVPHLGVRLAFGLVAAALGVAAVATAVAGALASRRRATADARGAAAPRPLARTGGPPALAPRTAILLAGAAGLATLVLEIVAARTAARIVGNGLYAWTSVLGAVLAGLAIGGAVGGALADRADPRRTLARLLVVSSALVLLAAWSPHLLVALVRESGEGRPVRIALGAAAAWLVPSAALGAIPPLAARAALGGPDDGTTIGRVWAAQTIGSVAGALSTGPLLVPALSTGGALVLTALGLALLPRLLGARVEVPWVASLALAGLAAVLPLEPAARLGRALALRADGSAILVHDSAYQTVRVDVPTDSKYASLGRPRLRQLALDGLVHNVVDLDDPAWLGYGYEGLYAAVTQRQTGFSRPIRALFVGGGACTFSRWLHRKAPDASIDVVELDPAVTAASVEGMGLSPAPGFRIVHADGRTFVRDLPAGTPRYDLVFGDAYDDLAVPWHLTTREYAREIRRVLEPSGAYVMNVIDAEGGGRFLGAVVLTLREEFPFVHVLSLGERSDGRDTFVVVATARADVQFLALRRPDPESRDAAATLPVKTFEPLALEDLVRRARGLVLTDDHAPVEWLLAPVSGTSSR